jgi:hypothetical protein
MLVRYLAIWVVFLNLAIFNGGVRDFLIKPVLGEFRSQQVSVATAIGLFAIVTWLVHRGWPIESAKMAILIGVMWMSLTVIFEVGMILWIAEKPLSAVREQYDIASGNLWVFVPLALLVLPSLVRAIQRA